jgi:ATP-dependent 26S proteasome regulatory subunit
MDDRQLQNERAQNLWDRSVRKMPPLERASELVAEPAVYSEQIGGLEQAQEEVLTYACAMTNPQVYENWGTFPPTGLLLIGPPGSGK